jgi:cysteine desulfurase
VRSGTENLCGAWALSRCLERYYLQDFAHDDSLPAAERHARYQAQCAWSKEFIAALKTIPGCETEPVSRASTNNGAPLGKDDAALNNASPWIVRASFADIPGGVMQRALDEKGFAVSTGSACSSRNPQSALSPVRFSFGYSTTQDDMNALLDAVRKITATMQRSTHCGAALPS